MRRLLRAALVAVLLLPLASGAALLLTAGPAAAAGLTRVTSFGNNPTNLNMYIYVPTTSRPAGAAGAGPLLRRVGRGDLQRQRPRLRDRRRPVRLHHRGARGHPQRQLLRRVHPGGAAAQRRQ